VVSRWLAGGSASSTSPRLGVVEMLKVPNGVTPFGSSLQCYCFVVADKFKPLLYRRQLPLQMRGGDCRLGVESESLSRSVESGFSFLLASSDLADLVSMFFPRCERRWMTSCQAKFLTGGRRLAQIVSRRQ